MGGDDEKRTLLEIPRFEYRIARIFDQINRLVTQRIDLLVVIEKLFQ